MNTENFNLETYLNYYPEIIYTLESMYENNIYINISLEKIKIFLIKNEITLDDLIMLINSNEITIDKLCNLKDKDIYIELYYKNKNDMKILFEKEQQGNTLKATTDMYTCRKCREKKCSYYELQIRSADEPMTKFIKCCNCGYEWRQS